MITLRKLAYLFIDEVSGGGKTTDSKLDERDVILKIRQILNEVMALKYFEKYQKGIVAQYQCISVPIHSRYCTIQI